jgi:ribosomal protein L11 methyltransferase
LASSPALDLTFAPGADRDLVIAVLDDFEPVAVLEPDTAAWLVHFRTAAGRDAALAALLARPDLGVCDLAAREVEDEDWARRSQRHLTALQVGRFTVAPPWDVPPTVAPDDLIVIEPSTGFGTGHHQTTRLCLRLLQEANVRGQRVIDVGTGSGILAIAAARLGARPVTAIDCDPDALDSARNSLERNGVTAAVDLGQADLATLVLPAAAVVTANLTAAVLTAQAGSLRALVAPGGTLIASGFGPSEVDGVAAALGLPPRLVEAEDEWVAVRFLVD